MSRRRIVVGMSGGVDSSTTAALLKREGHEVIGVGLKFPFADNCEPASGGQGGARSCCGLAGMDDARRVADRIGIPFYALNFGRVFEEEVIAGFCRSYLAGGTPNPCVDCNRRVKFGRLLELAQALGASHLATGHYARIGPASREDAAARTLLRKAVDPARDQSYFLYALSQAQLARALFPLGEKTKEEVRSIAKSLGLHVSEKPASRDICFIPGGDYRRLLADRFPEALQPGPIVDPSGKVLGEHSGTVHFTIGQRHGLKIAAREPLYVVAIDVGKRTVVAGTKKETLRETITVANLNWIAFDHPPRTLRAAVRIRHRMPESPASLEVRDDGSVRVRLDSPVSGVAAGQSAVFYDEDLVLGGGVIQATSDT